MSLSVNCGRKIRFFIFFLVPLSLFFSFFFLLVFFVNCFDSANQERIFTLRVIRADESYIWKSQHSYNTLLNLHQTLVRRLRNVSFRNTEKKAYGNRFAATVTEVACSKKISSSNLCATDKMILSLFWSLFRWPVTLPLAAFPLITTAWDVITF